MEKASAGWLFLFAAVALPGCSWSDPTDPHDDAMCGKLVQDSRSVEAIDWLKLAGRTPNHVGPMSNEESLGLAYALQEKGAVRVLAVGRPAQSEPFGEEAYGLVAALPDDPKSRFELFRLYARAVRLAGFTPNADVGQKFLLVPAGRAGGRSPD